MTNAVRLPLLRRNGLAVAYALVDESDYADISQWTWRLNGNGYASRGARLHGKTITVPMHREILGLAFGDSREVDHINHDVLDNRRENLRIVTRQENCQNVLAAGGSSPFRGVSRLGRKWRAAAKVAGRTVTVGIFSDELEAARAVDAFRQQHMPFAVPDPMLIRVDDEAVAA